MPTLTLPDGTVITLNVTNGVPLLPMDNSGIVGASPPACAGPSSSESVEEKFPTKEAESGGKPPTLGADKIPEEHFLTHLPKHPKCPACQAARMQNRQCRRQKHDENEEPKTKKFGDHITADHIVSLAEEAESFEGHSYAVVMRDTHTDWVECYPTALKSADDAVEAMQNFVGPRDTVSLIHTDCSGELKAAARVLGWRHSTSTP